MSASRIVIFTIAFIATSLAYDAKFDEWDVDTLIKDDKRMVEYVHCFLDNNDCTEEDAIRFKTIIPEILTTACEKCTLKQKMHIKKYLRELKMKHAELLNDLIMKYDPKGEHVEKFKEFLTQVE